MCGVMDRYVLNNRSAAEMFGLGLLMTGGAALLTIGLFLILPDMPDHPFVAPTTEFVKTHTRDILWGSLCVVFAGAAVTMGANRPEQGDEGVRPGNN